MPPPPPAQDPAPIGDPLAPHKSSARELKALLEAQRSTATLLAFRDHADNLQIFALGSESRRATIGRARAMDIKLQWDREVSAVHAELTRIGDDWIVADDGLSKNGTFVNGHRVVGQRRLKSGDRVRVGRTLLAFHAAASDEDEEPISATSSSSDAPVIRQLTREEMRVLVALCRPLRQGSELAAVASNKEIADEIPMAMSTVKNHLRNLSTAFGVRHLAQGRRREALAQKALRLGVVVPRDLEEDAPLAR